VGDGTGLVDVFELLSEEAEFACGCSCDMCSVFVWLFNVFAAHAYADDLVGAFYLFVEFELFLLVEVVLLEVFAVVKMRGFLLSGGFDVGGVLFGFVFRVFFCFYA
jgi:hypothetical protein